MPKKDITLTQTIKKTKESYSFQIRKQGEKQLSKRMAIVHDTVYGNLQGHIDGNTW